MPLAIETAPPHPPKSVPRLREPSPWRRSSTASPSPSLDIAWTMPMTPLAAARRERGGEGGLAARVSSPPASLERSEVGA